MKALVVCHKHEGDLGSFRSVLEERGFDIEFALGWHDKLPDINPLEHDLAIFMGGSMGVYQADVFPYLNNEIAYLKERVIADKPTLGICLGAQMIAKAMGQEVYPGDNGKEIGWHEIELNAQSKDRTIKFLDKSLTKIMQWHGDTFDLPNEAELLASSEQYQNQAYGIGKNVLALQFHPEMTIDNVEFSCVYSSAELKKNGINIPELRAETKERGDLLIAQTTKFFNTWLDKVIK